MKRISTAALVALALAAAGCSQRGEVTANYNVVPLPQEIQAGAADTGFKFDKSTVIEYADSSLATDAQHLAGYLQQMTGATPEVKQGEGQPNAIVLQSALGGDNPEAYTLTVTPENITINGASPAGTFYGIQTLRKAIPEAGNNNVFFPAVTISDQPRFAYRGAMLDVSRHFFPVDSVKSFIDMLALHNINTMHWHLSDDQGWRIEIKSRPLLTEKGSMRKGTVIGHNSGQYDSIPYGGFFTQEEARDIVRYAADRHINIVPEIDLPGHMLGALTAYPELGCTGGPYDVWQIWGVSEDVLCAGNDSTYKFIDDVLGEITEIFPSEYIHVGGDECPKVRWAECVKCQAKIKELGIKATKEHTAEEQLQSHVIHHASDFLATKGRKMIGWDEILEGGLAPGAIVMSWRGEDGGIKAAKQAHDVIMSPNSYLYFDYYQSLDREKEPDAIGGYIPVERVYSYEPLPAALTPEEAAHIIGVQANLWTEYIPTFAQVQYMELPRMAALAEVQWSNAPKDYKAFSARMPQMFAHYNANGYNYARHMFDIAGKITPDPENKSLKLQLSTVDDAPIHYTLDGTEPTEQSPEYTAPVDLRESCTVKALAFRPAGNSALFTDSVTFNKATAKPAKLTTEPHHQYVANGAKTLTDGKFGTNGFNNGDWVGYVGKPLVAEIDLEEPTEISSVAIRTCIDTGSWIFDAKSVEVAVSDNGKDFKTVATENYPEMTMSSSAIVPHTVDFTPVTARYVRVTVTPATIPAWHAGNGRPGFVFVDEIEIN